MAGQEVYMDVPKVMEFGKRFEDIGEVLEGVSNAMEVMMNVLKATAFIGFFGGMALERYLAQLKPIIDNLAEKTNELGGDLAASARAYQNGDAMGSTRFH